MVDRLKCSLVLLLSRVPYLRGMLGLGKTWGVSTLLNFQGLLRRLRLHRHEPQKTSARQEEEVTEALLEIKDALAEAKAFDRVFSSGDESILLGIDADEEDSCDDAESGRYSWLESEREVDPRPILSAANRVKESVKEEGL